MLKNCVRSLRVAAGVLIVGASLAVTAPTSLPGHNVAQAAEVADPGYQVKLRLDSDIVNSAGQLKPDAAAALNAKKPGAKELVAYFDDDKGTLDELGWTVRLRLKPGATQYDLTYKYRQPLSGNDLSSSQVDDALQDAKDNNFDSSDDNYEPQVNASYDSSTLDFSNKKKVDCEQWECVFPTEQVARKLVVDDEPGKLTKMLGGSLGDVDLRMSAVVSQQTQRIEVAGVRTDLEIAEMNGDYWVEVSEEDGSRKDAIRKRDALIEGLSDLGYLRAEDAFKTGKVIAGQW